MQYTTLGSSGLKISRIALGCMSFGDTSRGFNQWALDDKAAEPLFRQAVELGITFWDTANAYGYGTSEEITGRAISKYTRREDVVLATKVFFKMHDGPGGSGLSRRAIREQLDDSLRRLGTDYVDLYQIHRFDPETPVEETMAALRRHETAAPGRRPGRPRRHPQRRRGPRPGGALHPASAHRLLTRLPEGTHMRATYIYGAGDIRVINVPDPAILGREFGANHVIAERGDDGIQKVRDLTGGDGTHVVIEAVGHMPAYEQAVGVVRPGGVISRVGVPQYDNAPVGFGSLFGSNITLTGGPAPARAYIRTLMPGILAGQVNPGRVFDRELTLDQIPERYKEMDSRQALKVLIRP
jgi:Aldo/keto reductase family/Zinc-binding dehydrogenase